MVFVQGGKIPTITADEEKEVFNIVCKYPTTQKMWTSYGKVIYQ